MAVYRKSGVKFSPFSYLEMLAPIQEIQKVHDLLEQSYGTLLVLSALWQNKADKEKDPIAHALYARYAADLKNQALLLAARGVSSGLKRNIYDMAARYEAEIVPIDTASKKREALVNLQRALRLQNPTMLFEREAAGMSLDELILNPNADYGHAISGDFLAKQVATAASVLAKEARDSEEGKGKLKKMMLPFQYEYIKQKGFSREAVMEAILRGPNANKILTGIVDGVIKSSGVLDWGDKSTIAKAYYYANQGLYSAIGETTSQIVTDTYGAQRAAARAAAKANATPTGIKGGRVNPVPLRSRLGLAKANKNIENYKQYFTLDKKTGHYVLNQKGYEALKPKNYIPRVTPGQPYKGDFTTYGDPVFAAFMKSLNGNKNVIDSNGNYLGVSGPGNAGLLFQKYVKDNDEGSYDTYRSTAYRLMLNPEEGNLLKSAILGVSTEDIEEVDFDGKNGFKGTGNKLSHEDLKDYKVIFQDVTKYGVTATLIKDGAPPVLVMVPKSIAPKYYDNAVGLASQALEMSVYRQRGYYPIQDLEGNIDRVVKLNSAADAAKAQLEIDNLLYDMDVYGTNIRTATNASDINYLGM